MSSNPKKKLSGGSSRETAGAHRAWLRAQGLRPIEIWVPDTPLPNFAAEAARQACLVAQSSFAAEDQTFIDTISAIELCR